MPDESLPDFASVPAGSFVMGSDAGAADERPEHTVHLDAFRIGVSHVTQAQYARFVREARYRAPTVDDLPVVVRAGGLDREQAFRSLGNAYAWNESEPPPNLRDHPVTLVRWEDADAYCQWLSGIMGRTVRLPTEAEWEKAARGGLERERYPWGDRLDVEHANFLDDPALKMRHGTRTCRSYAPNGYGLYDMSGNAWEWVHDWYDPAYYASSPRANPPGPATGQFRIVRGGGWLSTDAAMLTCSHRHQVPADTYSYGIGFRVAYSGIDAAI
jgi:formylglycine-generating enzyme